MTFFRITAVAALLFSTYGIADNTPTMEELGLPTGPVEYEVHIGAIDMTCSDAEYNTKYDLDSNTIEGLFTLSRFDELGKDPTKFVATTLVTEEVPWIGLMNLESKDIEFEALYTEDLTEERLKKFGQLSSGLMIFTVTGKQVRDIIHGTVYAHLHDKQWLEDVISCTGEGSFLMLPK